MHPEKRALLRAINANPRDRLPQLVYADWLAERGDPAERFWRCERRFHGGLVGLGSRGSLGGFGGLGSLVGLGGLGGLGSLVGFVGFGGLGGLMNPENPIVLIPGENALVFMPHGYGFAVFVGYVAAEYPTGWILYPARTVEQINPDDVNDARWVELASGRDKRLRSRCKYGTPIDGGVRVPLGVLSIPWRGDLPAD